MVMESRFHENLDYISGFSLDDENTLPNFDQFTNHTTGYRFRDEPLDLSFLDVPPALNNDLATVNSSSQQDSPDVVTDFLNQFLMEENMENNNNTEGMFHDPVTLQAFENSFYEDLSEKHPPQPAPSVIVNFDLNPESPEEISGAYSTHSSTSGGDLFEIKSSLTQPQLPDSPPFKPTVNATTDSMINAHMVQNIFTDQESILQYKKGMEEASKFLPPIKPLIIDLDKYNLPSKDPPKVTVKVENIETHNFNSNSNSSSPDGFRARKHHHLEDNDYEDERSSKQKPSSAVCEEEEAQLSAMFDRILLCANVNSKADTFPDCHLTSLPPLPYNSWNASSWRSETNDSFDIRTLLINCAQSVASDDYRVATQQLNQIRRHASPFGNPAQRLAHVFAHGLEARLSGTGSQSRKSVKISAADKLKAFQAYVTTCPFKKNEVYFANRTIYEAASSSSTLHIVDFGIGYGFQWPILIKQLGDRRGGPPKLRITGIDRPEAGFRPAERVEETGRRLAGYCRRFNVPFEYNSIAVQNWETIKVEDFKVERNEFLAVNALTCFEKLLDESVVAENSPRDLVLKMIRELRPDVFLHSVVNGTYNAPFFVTRFKEALFHYSGLFDMFDATMDRGDARRRNYEREYCGNEVVNVIACEGRERVERPETYKQWQVRNMRAGFKAKRIDPDLVSQMKSKVKAGYHKDFVFHEDEIWMLQGWKGRILCGISCWVSA
ncbi:hypothetical protein Lser_V15G38370 [Lactuca serriola]